MKNITYDFAVGRFFFRLCRFCCSLRFIRSSFSSTNSPHNVRPKKQRAEVFVREKPHQVRNKFSMRPNKQRGHTKFYSIYVNHDLHLMINCMRVPHDTRRALCLVRVYAGGIWSYILLHELNRNACFAYIRTYTRYLFLLYAHHKRVLK